MSVPGAGTDEPDTGEGESDTGLDDLMTAWGLLTEAVVAVSTRLAIGLETTGHLTLPEFDVLVRLYREPSGRLPMTRLAQEIGLTAGGFSKLADRMELDGLIARDRAVGDWRTITAVLTEHGRTLTDTALVHHRLDLRQTLLDPLGPDRLRDLADLTRAVRDSNR